MKTIIVYICLLIMVYGNCYLASTDNLPAYYNHYFNIMPIALFFSLFRKKYAFSIDKKWLLLTGISFLFMTIIWERDKGNSSITLLCFMLIPQFCLKVLPKFKLTSILVFLKGSTAPLVLYVENPEELYSELQQSIKSAAAVLIEKETLGPLKKVSFVSNQVAAVALQEEQYVG